MCVSVCVCVCVCLSLCVCAPERTCENRQCPCAGVRVRASVCGRRPARMFQCSLLHAPAIPAHISSPAIPARHLCLQPLHRSTVGTKHTSQHSIRRPCGPRPHRCRGRRCCHFHRQVNGGGTWCAGIAGDDISVLKRAFWVDLIRGDANAFQFKGAMCVCTYR